MGRGKRWQKSDLRQSRNNDIIVVGATDSNDNLASFSAFGSFVDVVAPGIDVVTASSGSDTNYVYTSGTSFSTPLTAGLIGLIWSADSTLTSDEVEAIVKQGADDTGASGIDNTFGYGCINSYGSLLLVGSPPGNDSPVASLRANPTTGTAPLNVNFDASASFHPDGSIVNYEWDWEGDGIYDASTGTNPLANFTYTAANIYNATVRVTDDFGDNATDSVVITLNNSGGNPVSLADDGFESRSFNGGSGAWNGSWDRSGDVRIRWKKDSPHTDNGHVRLRRNGSWMERSANLAGTSSVHLTFWAKVRSFESSDTANVWVSEDGNTYFLVHIFTSADSDNSYHAYDLDLSGFNMTSDFRVVLESAVSSRKDYLYVDDIDFVGIQ